MQTATTQTFSVSLPSVYEHILVLRENIMAEHKVADNCLSYVSISLEELSFYDYYEGDDLLSRFRESCREERGPVEIITESTLPVAGFSSQVITAQSARGKFYYFGLVPVNSGYGYIIIGDCDISSRAFYEPLFKEIWESLQCFGDPAKAFNAGYNTTTPFGQEKKEIAPFTIPANSREYWQTGGHMFTLNEESECYISDGDGALYVKIEAQAPAGINPEQSDIITSYENGKVYLQFYFKGIYNAGIPTGKFHFENERNSSHLAYLWKGGFQYANTLTANVTLEEGWLGLNGYLNEYPVQLAVKLRVEHLDWTKYRFLSTQEVTTAAPELVRQLWLTDADAGLLQQTIQPLTHLQVLAIAFNDNETAAAAFSAIPEAVKHLKELKELSLTGVTELETLPQWLAELKTLQSIRVCDSKIEVVHPDIVQLPALTKLDLAGNQLLSVPPTLSASIESLVLSNNQLTTVPQSFTALQHLAIENNPLVQLPVGLENIPWLQLELEKKITLLNYTYNGADGKGTVPYDDNRFFAKYDPELLHLLEQQINTAGLEKFKDALINRARRSVALETTEADNYSEKGNHRFGGLPDLPPGESYPTFIDWHNEEKGYRFIAQINCAAIAHLQHYLPRTGILYFFIKDQEDSEPKVWYYEGDSSQLQSARDLNIEADFIYDQDGFDSPFKAEHVKYASIPPMYNTASLYPELAEMEELSKEAEQLQAGLKSSTIKPVHGINSYVFKQHGTPEIAAADVKRGKPDEWMVLLRVCSDRNPGFMFYDAGEIHFVIHKSDLEKKIFSNVYCGLESS